MAAGNIDVLCLSRTFDNGFDLMERPPQLGLCFLRGGFFEFLFGRNLLRRLPPRPGRADERAAAIHNRNAVVMIGSGLLAVWRRWRFVDGGEWKRLGDCLAGGDLFTITG
jgi:hypothetical protein